MRKLFSLSLALVFLIPAVLSADITFNLTGDAGISDPSFFGGDIANTVNDTFAYDIQNPTAALPDQVYSGATAFHGQAADFVDITVYYNLESAYTFLSTDTSVVFDFYGRSNCCQDRDNDYDVALMSGTGTGTVVAEMTGQFNLDEDPFHHRTTFNLNAGDTFDAIRVIGHDSASQGNNYFTIQEVRSGVLTAAVPEPGSLFILGTASTVFLARRKRRV